MTKNFDSTVPLSELKKSINDFKDEYSKITTDDLEYKVLAKNIIDGMEKMVSAAVEKLGGHIVEYPSLHSVGLNPENTVSKFKKLHAKIHFPENKGKPAKDYYCNHAIVVLSTLSAQELIADKKYNSNYFRD